MIIRRHFLTLAAAGSLAHEVVDELKDGPLAVLRLRGAFLLDAIPPCRECGGRHALTLHA